MRRILFLFLISIFYSVKAFAFSASDIAGKWANSDFVIEISPNYNIKVYEKGILIKEGSFGFWEDYFQGQNLIEVEKWDIDLKPDYGFYLIVKTSAPYEMYEEGAGETGKWVKLPENTTQILKNDYSGELSFNAFLENPKVCWKNLSWIFGEWRIPESHPSGKTYNVRITPFYYQATTEKVDSVKMNLSELPKTWYIARRGYSSQLGNIICINDLLLDTAAKRVYRVSGLNNKIYLEQTAEYTSSKVVFWIKTILLWGMIIAVGVGGLMVSFVLFRKLFQIMKSLGGKLIIVLNNGGKKIAQSSKVLINNTKESIECLNNKIRNRKNSNEQPQKFSITSWMVAVMGVYIFIFWDIVVGLLLLVFTLIYIIVKKAAPVKVEQIAESCKKKLNPITSKPMLAKGLTWLVVGALICRIFSGFIGFLIIVCSIIFLALIKLAPSVCGKVYGFYEEVSNKVGLWWSKRWVKVVLGVCFIALPFAVQIQNVSVFSSTIGSDIQEYHIDRKIDRIEDKKHLSEADRLKIRYLELRKEGSEAYGEYMQSMRSPAEREKAWETYQYCNREMGEIQEKLIKMGVHPIF